MSPLWCSYCGIGSASAGWIGHGASEDLLIELTLWSFVEKSVEWWRLSRRVGPVASRGVIATWADVIGRSVVGDMTVTRPPPHPRFAGTRTPGQECFPVRDCAPMNSCSIHGSGIRPGRRRSPCVVGCPVAGKRKGQLRRAAGTARSKRCGEGGGDARTPGQSVRKFLHLRACRLECGARWPWKR